MGREGKKRKREEEGRGKRKVREGDERKEQECGTQN